MKPELLAPAGDWKMLRTAVNNGADAVYFGVEKLNMRAKAKNFLLDELKDIVGYCDSNNVEAHLTLNTIVYEDEVDELNQIVSAAKDAGVHMIICWDMSVIQKCREFEMPFCVSTQASVSNIAAVNLYKALGAKRIVLARECTLEQIKEIKSQTDVEIEAFIHGAMCVAVSGRCFMSHSVFGKSANRGECIQPCRREYKIIDKDGANEFVLGEDYVLSPKDLCSINFLDLLIEAEIDAFKIEGRKRSPEYIEKVVSTYRKAIDLYFEGALDQQIKSIMYNELGKVYNRGFSTGFYFGTPDGREFADKYGSKAATRKVYIGRVLNYFKKSRVAHVKLEAGNLSMNDAIYIIGDKTGCIETEIVSLVKDNESIIEGNKGEEVTFLCKDEVRPRDQVFRIFNVDSSAANNVKLT
ncbi:MAG: U32 family peptidase [Melioribacteraceae bacterium]|nr:U32 family peptidase [Melioribacteraceae bacterium]